MGPASASHRKTGALFWAKSAPIQNVRPSDAQVDPARETGVLTRVQVDEGQPRLPQVLLQRLPRSVGGVVVDEE